MEGEINKVLDNFFVKLRTEGMRAIAYCDNEKGRVTMLGLLEYAAKQEITLKQIIKELSLEDSEVFLTNKEGIDSTILQDLAPGSRIIETNKEEDESE